MPAYAYKAMGPGGQVQTGEIDVDGESAAIDRVQEMGLQLITLNSSAAHSRARQREGAARRPRKARVKLEDLAMFSRQLAIMIASGVPITEALESLELQVKTVAFQSVINDLRQQVLQGHSLSQSLARHPSVFSQLYVDLVKTAEAGGELSQVMDQLAQYLESNLEIIRKVKSAMMYPIIVVVASLITVVSLVTFVLPRFMTLFKQMGAELPPTTQALLTISRFTLDYWYFLIIGAAVAFFALKMAANSTSGRRWLDWLKLHAPPAGDLVRKIVLSRSLLALGTLLNGGVPLMIALETAAEASGNQIIGSVYRFTKSSVESGSSIADAFKSSPEFPPLLIQMTSVGERTGELPNLLLRVSEFYYKESDARIKGLTSIIEPVLIVILGTLVGFIAISIIAPIYSLVGGTH